MIRQGLKKSKITNIKKTILNKNEIFDVPYDKLLNEIQKLIKIGIWEFNVENNKIIWSDNLYNLYERDIALGPPNIKDEATYYSTQQSKTLRDYAKKCLKTGKEIEYEFQVNLPSNKSSYFRGFMYPIKNNKNKVTQLLGVIQDISNQKRNEIQLREKIQEMEKLNKLMIGRELKMVELKQKINKLEKRII